MGSKEYKLSIREAALREEIIVLVPRKKRSTDYLAPLGIGITLLAVMIYLKIYIAIVVVAILTIVHIVREILDKRPIYEDK